MPHTPGSARGCERIDLHTPKGTPTLGVGVPVDSWMSRERLQGSKPNGLRSFLYHWKDIETQMSKMGSHDPFGHLQHKLCPKEGSGVKLAIWLPTTKSQESTRFCCVQVACNTSLESSRRRLQLCFTDLILIRGLHAKLWGPKVTGILTLAKSHLDVGPVGNHRVYYKGGRWWLPSSPGCGESCESELLVVHLNTKSASIMHSPTCCLVLCRSVWVNKCLSIFLVPSRSFSTPLYPSKVLQAREHAPTPNSSVVFSLNSHLNLPRSLGTRHMGCIKM
jgi:hypothetical protein